MSASPRFGVKQAAPLAIAVLAAWSSATCLAQYRNDFDVPFSVESDYQWFEPVDVDLDRLPTRNRTGFTFTAEKFYWAVTNENVPVGDPDVDVFSEVVFPGNSASAASIIQNNPNFQLSENDVRLPEFDDAGNLVQPGLIPLAPTNDASDPNIPIAPEPYKIENGINSGPGVGFGWGDRYELGYVGEQGNGVMLGIIDGNPLRSFEVYGFPLDTDNPGVGPEPFTGFTPRGFGSVHVNFELASDFLLVGFRDYGDFEAGPAVEPPGVVPGTGADEFEEAGNGPTVDGPGNVVDAVPDNQPDDILPNGGYLLFIDTNPADGDDFNPLVDVIILDFGDLHNFNVRFNQLFVENRTRVDGVELMFTHDLSNRHFFKKHQNQSLRIQYGVRYLRLRDDFRFEGFSDVLGFNSSRTKVNNNLIGPQIGARWNGQYGKFNFALDGRVLLAYNLQRHEQDNLLGEDLAPGALNRPLLLQPTTTNYGQQVDSFSPHVEFRADMRYSLTRNVAFKLGYTAQFTDSITRAAPLVRYRLPDMGFRDTASGQNIFINGVNFGVEFWH
ncbi:MAG: BBP7 family outer membrane beta-barrel protein [Planctomycetota bacterium]